MTFSQGWKKANSYQRANFFFNILSLATLASIAIFSGLLCFKKFQVTSMIYVGIALIALSFLLTVISKLITYKNNYEILTGIRLKNNVENFVSPIPIFGEYLQSTLKNEMNKRNEDPGLKELKSFYKKTAALSVLQPILFTIPFLTVGILTATKVCNIHRFKSAMLVMGTICVLLLLTSILSCFIDFSKTQSLNKNTEIFIDQALYLFFAKLILNPIDIILNFNLRSIVDPSINGRLGHLFIDMAANECSLNNGTLKLCDIEVIDNKDPLDNLMNSMFC